MQSLVRLLHLLIFVYWLGGDLGAFVASYFVTDPRRPAGERMVALRILSAVDAAPIVALLLTLPSGVWLSRESGWWTPPALLLPVLATITLVWVPIALLLHFDGTGRQRLALGDTVLRVLFITALAVLALASLAGVLPELGLPRFMAFKLLCLAAATACGLALRVPLRHFFAAMAPASGAPDADALRYHMRVCRAWVIGIWFCLLVAATLGVTRPA